MEKSLTKDLLKMRMELEIHLRQAVTFGEEAVLQSVIYSIGNALDILNGKKTLLQGLMATETELVPTEEEENNGN